MCLLAILFFGPRVITMIELYEHHKEQPQMCICKSFSIPECQLCLLLRKKKILYCFKRKVLRFVIYEDTRKVSKICCHNGISVGYTKGAIWLPSNK
jgi:hypothetical protein